MTVRVLVHDQQTLTLLGVRTVLEAERDIEVVRETRDARRLVALTREHAPDVVLVGLPLQGTDVLDLVRRILDEGEERAPGVIVMTTPTHEDSLLDALRAGVRGVASKESPPSELVHTIRSVAAGGAVLTSTMTRHLLEWASRVPMASRAQNSVVDALSRRERTVLELVSSGMSDEEVAAELHVSTATVRSHIHHITSKLGMSGRTQVVAFAYRQGLVVEAPSTAC
ncbi:DNA-binding NarL/FixJ family response regulator [Actinomadura pelletieri DSM 43383]|uniref:DNA-binding NarL/FixJ family response regulator n=1 Tax=Actinomadura pelletieri DSM 43383 TaxID=1120940 RepID=A0A495QU46_9ACTN|nr:response regulator transcription factor [Actinomadura pelletieri]RKS77044.1 DNA-binding NarL/FixJ family response regulator [Actinomadura pelletieri DSM 43383]